MPPKPNPFQLPAPPTSKRPRPKRKKSYRLSDEGRAKLSRLAKERVARGEMGGAKFGAMGGRGKSRERRIAQQAVAEAAGEYSEQIIAVFKDATDPKQRMVHRLRGAELWLMVERENAKLALAEERMDSEKLTREQLIDALAEKLTKGPIATMMRQRVENGALDDEDIIDAVVIEDVEERGNGHLGVDED